MENILVLGGSGLVGSRFVEMIDPKAKLIVPSHAELNLLKLSDVSDFISQTKPSAIINFAGFANVDGAENEKGEKNGPVYQLNSELPKILAQESFKRNTPFVHISTGMVFPGTERQKGPYSEDIIPAFDHVNMGWYAETKLYGEQNILEQNSTSAIVRIDYPFRSNFSKTDFARNILDLYDQDKLYPLFADQFLRPTWMDDLNLYLLQILEQNLRGIFHVVSKNNTTPYEFAEVLLKKARGVENIVQKSSIVEFREKFPQKAPRLQYGGLESEKTQQKLRQNFLTWEEQIDRLVEQL